MGSELQVGQYLVAIIGAGPAGLFAARELAVQGAVVFLFNRDIKPGGLAEYGIYPTKFKMKDGLRNQFRQILEQPNIHYFGNINIGTGADLTLDDLRSLGFQAILVTAGAQGTKWLGVPGEELGGVYHAKDLVYFYNRLPPYSETPLRIGKHAAVIGMGNVMLDITRWLLEERGVQHVTSIARRGPAEVKFDRKELETTCSRLDISALEQEIQRVAPQMIAAGQAANELPEMVRALQAKSGPPPSGGNFSLNFLMSPHQILGDPQGHVCGLEVEDMTLTKLENGEPVAHGTGHMHVLEIDTVIFAIGDKVDPSLGLPVRGLEFVKNPHPRFPIDGITYETFNPDTQKLFEDIFIAGWARKASTGLVGVARKDGTNGAHALQAYLAGLQPLVKMPLENIQRRLNDLHKPLVTNNDLVRLEQVEREHAIQAGVEHFKFGDNASMLEAMGLVETSV